MFDFSPALIGIRLLAKPAILTSPGGHYVDGVWQEHTATTDIMAVVQSSSQEDVIQFSDGERLDGYVTIYTETELRPVDEDDQLPAQTITTPKGDTYRIVKAGRRDEAGFTRAIGRHVRDRGRSVQTPA